MSKLQPGQYTVTITGPSGVILQMSTRIEERGEFNIALDDEYLPELMVLNSMPQGIIEHELHKRQEGGAA